MDRFIIVLAAGQGTRMKSKLYKVLHEVCGQPMVQHVVNQAEKLHPEEMITIVGFGAEKVKEQLKNQTKYVIQEEQLGTGHAVLQTKKLLEGKEGTTVVLSGDAPLLTSETIEALFADHQKEGRGATILSAMAPDPKGYGRIIRNEWGEVAKIVEEKDTNEKEAAIQEINTGTYCFDNKFLFESLEEITTKNAQNEYYLTDVIEIMRNKGQKVGAFVMDDFNESMGVNDRVALSKAQKIMQQRINEHHMKNGVTFLNPENTTVEMDVAIGQDTIIEGNVTLRGKTVIGKNCHITSGSDIKDAFIENDVVVKASHIEESTVRENSDVGPFAHLRPGSVIGEKVHIGNFVEVKNSSIEEGTKVGHLTYVGDAALGKNINVSCGVIFANYDGKNKAHTTVGDNVFIGSNVNLIAPLMVEDGAFLAAGSTITKDVPEDSLAIARSRQENKLGFAKKLPYHE